MNLILIHITSVRAGKLPEDQLFAAVRSMEAHYYSEQWKDRHLAELKHSYDWWNDRFEISTSYRLPKLTIVQIMEITREFMDDLVRLAISYHGHILIHMPSA